MMNGFGGFGMWGGAVVMILILIGAIFLALWGFRLLFPDQRSAPSTLAASAVEIAQLRYSRGEISHDEYLALVTDLKQSQETTK